MHGTKARNLQAKISALKKPVTRIILILPAEIVQDLRGCIERLQMIDTEFQNLLRSQKDLAKQQNGLEGKVAKK